MHRLPAARQAVVNARLADEERADVIADAVAAMDLTDLLVVVKQTRNRGTDFAAAAIPAAAPGVQNRSSTCATMSCTPFVPWR